MRALACACVLSAVVGWSLSASADDAEQAPKRVGAITLEKAEHSLYCGVIDESNRYACFSTTSKGPAYVVKVALGEGDAPPKRVAALQLPAGYTHAIAAVATGSCGGAATRRGASGVCATGSTVRS